MIGFAFIEDFLLLMWLKLGFFFLNGDCRELFLVMLTLHLKMLKIWGHPVHLLYWILEEKGVTWRLKKKLSKFRMECTSQYKQIVLMAVKKA